MRAAPAFQVSLRHFGVWQAAALLLAALGLLVMTAWLATRGAPLISPTSIAAGCAAICIVTVAFALAKVPPVDLRWDGRAWHLTPDAGQAQPGDLHVAIDLGPWMLLRFSRPAPGAGRRNVWLPAQRRRLESQWHALRCAVYSPHPSAAADDPPQRV